ncbi:PecA family PE domain-processing aspartic protease [Mycolicibacter icosiumassiliensis]|uniref:PecA family PE domain-processing aspartic protease n=1 Tax=Mycolicibacter icosiumassiliensis TaxID=1792835 RepID=UPI00082CBE89|nr:PecA family PE domain-processing aspartic protease [Mycolicibacter icosiumassiliensis]
MSARRHRLVGAVGAVGAVLALGVPAPAAQADWDDLFQPIVDAISWVDPGIAADTDPGSALASLDTLFNGWYQDLIYTPLHSIAPWAFGDSQPGSAAAYGPDSTNLPDHFTVPMNVNLNTQPVINVSVGGGGQTEVLVDTGAAGLVMPIWNINPFGITGLPTGFNIGQFGGALNYFYLELPTTVTFTAANGDTVTADTTVDAVLFAFPANFNHILDGWSIESYLAGSATGILGIGPNALGPTPDHIPTRDLPGDLGNGVLIDQAHRQLIFGDNPYHGGTVIPGAPWSDLKVQLNDGPLTNVRGVIDSGGVYGTMPSSALGGVTPTSDGHLPEGTTISVYAKDGTTLLYTYTVGSQPGEVRSPTVVGGKSMNTGNWLFGHQPVYIDYSVAGGRTIIGGTPIEP